MPICVKGGVDVLGNPPERVPGDPSLPWRQHRETYLQARPISNLHYTLT